MSSYPTDAACAGHRDPTLWDAAVAGESPEYREWRHNRAKAICRRCPVADDCGQDWTKGRDEGIRAERELPLIHPRPPRPRLTAPTERARLISEGVSEDVAAIIAPVGAKHRREMKKAS